MNGLTGRNRFRFPGTPVGVAALVLLATVLASCGNGDRVPEVAVTRAQQALEPFKGELYGELTTELRARGAEGAIAVYRERAHQIAASASPPDVEMGQTSHRLRNPDNAPAPWLVPLLQEYAASPTDREPRAVRLDANHVGYVEPIHVKPLCLTCHGEEIEAPLQARLLELYPEDQADGFHAGDFRGLYWVKVRLPDLPASTRRDPAI